MTQYIPKKINLKYVKEVRPGGMITSAVERTGLESKHELQAMGLRNAQAIITWQEIKKIRRKSMNYKGYLIDLDGTIYKGKDRIQQERLLSMNCKKRDIPLSLCDQQYNPHLRECSRDVGSEF